MNQGGGSSIKVTSTAVKGQMKGLLKGLRYISQMFDEEDEEKEIQIGFPTDVKHLAHIGCEDAKANAPSWMTEFKETHPQLSPGAPVNSTNIPEGQDSDNNSDTNSKSGGGKRSHVRRSRQRSSESQSLVNNSPTREGSNEGSTKPTRRHHSSESSRRNNRHSTEEEDNKPPTTTKHSHRRKSKTTTTSSEEKENSTRKPSRTPRSSKADSLTDISFTDLGPGPGSGPATE